MAEKQDWRLSDEQVLDAEASVPFGVGGHLAPDRAIAAAGARAYDAAMWADVEVLAAAAAQRHRDHAGIATFETCRWDFCTTSREAIARLEARHRQVQGQEVAP